MQIFNCLLAVCAITAASAQQSPSPQAKIMKAVSGRFMLYVEHNKIDSAISLMAPEAAGNRIKLYKELQIAAKDIQLFKARSNTSLMLIGSKGDQFYRWRYHQRKKETPVLYRIDMYFSETVPGKITKVKLFNSKYMENDFKENQMLKYSPPSPPPPVKHK